MIRYSYTRRGHLLNRTVVCPHCLKPGSGRRKLNRHCPPCGEAVHRICLPLTAPAHDSWLNQLEALRSQGISPGSVFPQISDWTPL